MVPSATSNVATLVELEEAVTELPLAFVEASLASGNRNWKKEEMESWRMAKTK